MIGARRAGPRSAEDLGPWAWATRSNRVRPRPGKEDGAWSSSKVSCCRNFDVAIASVKASLVAAGFGVLTEIDVQATLREKIGKKISRYVILGACNPNLAGRALDIEPQMACSCRATSSSEKWDQTCSSRRWIPE